MEAKLGVIGGMGPEATVYFYEEVTAATVASSDQEHIDLVILSHASMPDRTEAILTGNTAAVAAELAADARTLGELGVEHIAVPCNTSHYFYDAAQAATSASIIHMPREAVRYACAHLGTPERPVRRIGIMATDGTIRTGIYARECEAAGVEAVAPSPLRQHDVMSLIYNEIKAGRSGDPQKFWRVVEELVEVEHCDAVILACTELSVYKRDHEVPPCCLDAMDVLVRESVLRSGAEYCGPLA